jgi:hypothetical protein
MIDLNVVCLMSPQAQIAFYLDKEAHYQKLAKSACTDGSRATLEETARDFAKRAMAVKAKGWAPTEGNIEVHELSQSRPSELVVRPPIVGKVFEIPCVHCGAESAQLMRRTPDSASKTNGEIRTFECARCRRQTVARTD